jgi:hypothetical protein
MFHNEKLRLESKGSLYSSISLQTESPRLSIPQKLNIGDTLRTPAQRQQTNAS